MRFITSKIPTIFLAICTTGATVCSGAKGAVENTYLDMNLSQLMQVTITSVSKKPQALSDAAAAVFVITQEDIHRSGVTSIPEALRMAPGLQVARIGSSKWAISSRGLNGLYSNKLLVLIDGRTVYRPGFSGTDWDMQNTLLEDIDRIEVIRGPGATLWGANAVNGIINIITKNSADTLGGLVKAGGGTEEELLGGFRYGAKISEDVTGRLYVSYNQRDSFQTLPEGTDSSDDWDTLSGGFRLDGQKGQSNSWTLQGDIFANNGDQPIQPFFIPTPPFVTRSQGESDSTGGNILGRWEHTFSATESFKAQLYYDYTDRDELFVGQTYKTVDLDLQYEKQLGDRNNLTVGFGYRNIDTTIDPSIQASLNPGERNDDLFSAFFQDVITLVPEKIWFTIGTKWEHNEFTGNELQPTGRLLWKPTDTQTLWGSVSRAIRTPSQFERTGSVLIGFEPRLPPFPAFITVLGNSNFDSEEVIAYETGYRWFPSSSFSLDLALFYNDYDDLLATRPGSTFETLAIQSLTNDVEGKSYGAELMAEWQPQNWLEFVFTYTFLELDFKGNAPLPAIESVSSVYNGSAPQHQASLRGAFHLSENWQANIWLRYVGELDKASQAAEDLGITIDDYFECDLALSWKPLQDLEVMLVGQNLLSSSHPEFVSEFFIAPTEVERGAYVKLAYTF